MWSCMHAHYNSSIYIYHVWLYVSCSSKMSDSLEISNECLIKDVEVCLGKQIGTGSYGVVYVATYHGSEVAAKKLHSIFFEDVSPKEYQGILQSWKNELKLMSSLKHPNIVQFYGVFNSDDSSSLLLTGNSYIITELLAKSLQARNVEKPWLTVRHVIDIAMDIATGLCYLHNRPNPIMHRDLASKNILLSLSGQAKIADLGVAKFTEQVQQSHTRHPGTDYYMPLETLISDYNHSIDVYALGVIILEMAINKNPTATQNLKKVGDHLEVVPEKERRRNDFEKLQTSPKKLLENVIMLCLREKETRVSASDVVKNLKDLKESETYHSCDACGIFSVEEYKLKEENRKLKEGKAKMKILEEDLNKSKEENESLKEENERLKAKVQTLEENLRKSEQSESQNKQAQYGNLVSKSNTDAIQRSSKGPNPHVQLQQTTRDVPMQKTLPQEMVQSMVVPKQHPTFHDQPFSLPAYNSSFDQSRSSQSYDQPQRSFRNLRLTQNFDQLRSLQSPDQPKSPQSYGQPARLTHNLRSTQSFDQPRSEQSLDQLKSSQRSTQNTSIFDQPGSLQRFNQPGSMQRFDQPGSMQRFDQPGALHTHDQPKSPQSYGQPARLTHNLRSTQSFDQPISEQNLDQLKSSQRSTQNTSIFDQPGSMQRFDQPVALHTHDQIPSSAYRQQSFSESSGSDTAHLYSHDNLPDNAFSSQNSLDADFSSLPARLSYIPTQKATEYLAYQLSCMNRVMLQLKSANYNTSETLVTSFVETLREQITKTTDYISKLLIDTKPDQHLHGALQKIYRTLSGARFDNIRIHPTYIQDLNTAIRGFQDALNKYTQQQLTNDMYSLH